MLLGALWFVLSVLPLTSTSVQIQIPAPDESLHVYALPIGQGDATVVQCPKNTGGLTVVDIGSTKFAGFMTRSDVTSWLGTQRVDAVFLSHPHTDHYNFIDALGDNINQEGIVIYHACDALSYKDLESRTDGWNASLVRVTRCIANDYDCGRDLPPCQKYQICNEGLLRVLASELNSCSLNKNEDSMVLKLEYQGTSLLLLGDLEDPHANYGPDDVPLPVPGGPYDILLSCSDVQSTAMKIAHHGAYGKSNKPDLYFGINPQLAFSSSGFNFDYYHPRCNIHEFYTKWIAAAARDPDILQPALQVSRTLEHWYTCGDYLSKEWRKELIDEAMYVTSVCTFDVSNATELVNFVVGIKMETVSGMLAAPSLAHFNTHTASTFPGKFPC